MRDKAELFNLALGRLGVDSITGPDDKRHEAVLCERNWHSAVNEILCLGSFACSLASAELAKLDEPGSFGMDYVFQLPNDFLQLVETDSVGKPHRIEGRKLFSVRDRIAIRYVRKISDVSSLSPLVAECVVLRLASKIAGTLTRSPGAGGAFEQELLSVALPNARAAECVQKRSYHGAESWLSGEDF